MKLFKLVVIFFIVGQIFATPLMRACDMMDDEVIVSCCAPDVCECDNDLPEKIDALKKQVKTTSIDFHFEYAFNSVLEIEINLEHDELLCSFIDFENAYEPPGRFRAKLQVFII